MAAELARRKIGLVYGGGNVGLMGVIADAVLGAGGDVQGVMPEHLIAREIGHKGLTKLHVVRSMHERKALMADLSDAFVALPGGFGTLEEFCEVVTWTQLGLHAKPCGILNVLGFYSPLLRMFDYAVEERFLKPENRALVLARDKPAELLQALEEWRPVRVEKWLGSGDAVNLWVGEEVHPLRHSQAGLRTRHGLSPNGFDLLLNHGSIRLEVTHRAG
jgi:uncharacterized protein (TIGR00730 family)